MTGKTKLFLFLLFLIMLLAAGFFAFHRTASMPEKILLKNSNDDVAEIADSPPEGGLSATDSAIINSPENVVKDPEPAKQVEVKNKLPASLAGGLITKKLVSWGFTLAKNRTIDTIIIHSSYNALGGDKYDVTKLIQEYKEYGVAPHYLIDRQGKIYQLVEDKNIAYHAGESKTPDGHTGVNNFSLGIEVATTEEEKPTSAQYFSLNSLLSDLKTKYSIKYVLGHSDIASSRKTDPWNFEWEKVK